MIFDRYVFRTLLLATLFVAAALVAVVFLTQSMRFLELVIESGASGTAFWVLTLLALPRFFEIILPIALMAATVFVYNKMSVDSELVVMRQAGFSPLRLARPALALAALVTVLLWLMTMWLGPVSLSKMQQMRQVIKAQYSSLLLREGVFNAPVDSMTVYIREKDTQGELRGIMIHDRRERGDPAVTVLAKRGAIVATDSGQQVLVYDGVRQSLNPETGALDRLDFARYSIDLPDGSGPVRQRWAEPDERTFWQLLNPDMTNARDRESRRDFMIEAQRRVISPLLAPAFVLVTLGFLLLGPHSRHGQVQRIIAAVSLTIVLQGLYLAAFNWSMQSSWGLCVMYLIVAVPVVGGLFLLSRAGEGWRRVLLYRREAATR